MNGIRDAQGHLTNAGTLLADDAPIRWSRLFCTRWNGLDKSGGQVDALDSAEYSGSLIILLNEGMSFVKNFKASSNEALNEAINEDLIDNQKMLLDILCSEPTITQKEIIERTLLSRSTIQRAIKELTEMGRLERIGSKKTGSWVVKE